MIYKITETVLPSFCRYPIHLALNAVMMGKANYDTANILESYIIQGYCKNLQLQ
jgi:hypothetical protein